MKRFVRLFAVALLLLVVATPSFAFCRYCGDDSICHRDPEAGGTCMQSIDFCTFNSGACARSAERATLLDQFSIASVEVTHPAGITKTTTTQPVLASFNSNHLPVPAR